MADRLAALMTHFPMRAQVFNTGPLCGINTLQSDGVHGQLHLIRRGAVEVRYGRETLHVTQPSLLLFPRPLTHRFITAPDCEVDMVCANLTFEGAGPTRSPLPWPIWSACRWMACGAPSRCSHCCSKKPSNSAAGAWRWWSGWWRW